MYFGTPSPQGKFYKGLSTDTPVNHDLHWRDRVVKENHMVKTKNKKRRPEMNPDMFVKRPWTQEEEQQLRDAVMRHGPNNWEVVCRDRTYIEMIGNHTMEDIKTKWRTIEKARIRSRRLRVQHQAAASPGKHGGGGGGGAFRATGSSSLNVLNQLKLKQTLKAESTKRQQLSESINRERIARLEAEKKAAIQMRERRKLEEKLRQFQKMAKSSSGATLSKSASRSNPLQLAGRSSVGARPVVPMPRIVRPEDDVGTMMERLTSRSTAIQQSAATRLRARAILDSVREQRKR